MIMLGTQTELIVALRSMARQGNSPSEMRTLLARSKSAGGYVDRNLLVQYFSEAFCLLDGQAYPIFGWLPDGTGELKDADLDYLLARRIEQARGDWEKAP